MTEERGVTVRQLVKDLDLHVFNEDSDLDRMIQTLDINRPGLALAGYLRYHPAERVQVLGRTELSFLRGMNEREQALRVFAFCSYQQTPCILITRNDTPPSVLLREAAAKRIPVLGTNMVTTRLTATLSTYLEERLAPETLVHGVLVDVYGIGILITGASGIGKSETGLELIKRGHRLVADDAVVIRQISDESLIGSAPPLLQHLLEIRGLGVLNAMTLFGAGAVRTHKKIALVIHLEAWRENVAYDRLGIEQHTTKILDLEVPHVTVPVRPGRNLAVIVEVAAMNFRLKGMGYDAAKAFTDELEQAIAEQADKDKQ
ncbi:MULTISPECIES: HPr(Ser) kinase/phosphatase [Alicyclobacillus]|uniref:HPr kinase/phosphorylase n=1 Tax=Alicyclobacillus acidoterrestris (strain ATCC 49025 / DSM 3922 / CIP 106132 / NCIMB 13137 / GD3B) TaxID=1356854 RepID=T0CZK2_ALIAG|nr:MULTISPECIES: HPr(Ser) kinase/phosphatase [Alicyclobacillus]EPZ42976.1 HPr kinase [Alicyclobacillus acidoterrestris ATCC 49025]UNO49772.1 HPr(Ser) kinase/phosphatase [Alicyclobacillus acidoterrestris]GEO26162.1 HPr kinase/phosphorylase [Alicyclobacillus acidoterrestris]